jgi:hypothetical protein
VFYFSEHKQLRKAAVLHFAFFCGWGCAKLSLPII